MATTVSDLITPSNFAVYTQRVTNELSKFSQAGILSPIPDITGNRRGGETVNLPFFEDLTGEDEVLVEGQQLTVKNITAGQDIATIHGRGAAFSVTGLSAILSGEDPMKAIVNRVAAFWARQQQAMLLATLKGVFKAPTMDNKKLDISGEATPAANSFNKNSFIDALQTMGDVSDRLAAIAMHSATFSYLKKSESSDITMPSTNSAFSTYQGRRVIIDDGLPVDNGVYTSYLFGTGAVGYGDITPPQAVAKTDEDILSDEAILALRRYTILHPRGIRYSGVSMPTNLQLQDGTAWQRVYEEKDIRLVQFKHKIA